MMDMQTWIYLPNGCKVCFNSGIISMKEAEEAAEADYATALLYTNRLLALGASVNAPGLEDGEQKEQVGYVVYRSKVNDDATETPIIDLYLNHDATKFKFLTVYLNTPEDIEAFRQASGHGINELPYWEGGHLERGNPKTDKYFIAPRKPLTVVHKLNERYNPDEPDMTKRKPKRLFVRWESAGIPTPASQPAAAQPPANPFAGQQQPAQPKAGSPHQSVLSNVYRVNKFQVNLSKGRVPQPYLIFAIGETEYAYSYTRQPFAEAGYDVTDWKNVGNHEMPCPAEITVEKHVSKDGKVADQWTVKSVKMIDLFAEAS